MKRRLILLLCLVLLVLPVPAPAAVRRAPAMPLRTVAPEMPASFRREFDAAGEVTVQFYVSETGDVMDPKIISSTHRELEEPTMEAVRQWKFKPATVEGEPVISVITIPVRFVLEG